MRRRPAPKLFPAAERFQWHADGLGSFLAANESCDHSGTSRDKDGATADLRPLALFGLGDVIALAVGVVSFPGFEPSEHVGLVVTDNAPDLEERRAFALNTPDLQGLLGNAEKTRYSDLVQERR
jgi:hypothetical protein